MRIVLILIIGLHGLIHLFGFVKAFKLMELKALSQMIAKPFGILWMTAFILFVLTAVLFAFKNNYWWLLGIISVVLSQILIISFWNDTKFGTIPNLIILFVSITAYANYNFNNLVNTEVTQMLTKAELNKNTIVSREMVTGLPMPVQKWLENTGIIGNEMIQNVYLKQEDLIKMKPSQTNWYKAEAKQYFTTKIPAFNWSVNMQMNPLITVTGRDKFENGEGEMLIKVFSLFPVVDAKENYRINEAALQRYLAEIVWFPSVALSSFIIWEKIDDLSAKATLTYKGTTGSGNFYFDEDGSFKKFSALRYMNNGNDSELKEWVIEAIKSKIMNGIKIPVELKASWKLGNKDWTWLQLKITEIEYNIEKING